MNRLPTLGTGTQAVDLSAPAPIRRAVGLPSIGISAIAFAIVLFIVGGLGPIDIRRLQMVTSLVMTVAVGRLLMMVSQRHGLAPHVGYLMMLAGVLYWYLAPAFFLSLKSDYRVLERHGLRLHPESVGTACVCIAMYTFTSVMAYWFFYFRCVRRMEIGKSVDRFPRGFLLIVVGLFLAGFVPFFLFGGGLDNVIAALSKGRADQAPWRSGPLGDSRSALYYITRSGMVAASGFAGSWAILAKRSRQRGVLLAMFGLTTLLVYFDGGTRSWVALAAVPTALAWVATRVRKRLNIGNILVGLLIVISIQFAFEFARASRNLGWNLKALSTIDLIKREFDNDFFSELVVSVDLVPRRHDYFYFGDLWSFVAHPVPRAIWKDKPIPPTSLYYNKCIVSGGLLRSSANKLPSHIGQFHMSLGLVGVVILGFLSGLMSAVASALMQSPEVRLTHVGGVIATWWFLMARGLYPAWMYVVIFAILIGAVGFRTVLRSDSDDEPAIELETVQSLVP